MAKIDPNSKFGTITSYRISQGTRAALDAASLRLGVSRSRLIDQAIIAYLVAEERSAAK
ncbi:ribbon-helix-helix domain-containing protein [Bradyrhizobium sp. 41S5]|uniref:ribbon-helix-helix domain-containing protein n=1 Tax=Bradyrhizobium sp. 41S5 TaxID=1404443 RepID=UPI00156B0CE5|nr:ribbon-helix-helix domain-containing protein [Bradyrhizobium sp. 41S5]UFX46132.1 ribbon-helix-helix domain-containing protein [Bradyrhizobium sp. 41S5]